MHSLSGYLCEQKTTYLVCLSSLDIPADERPCFCIDLARDVITTVTHIMKLIILCSLVCHAMDWTGVAPLEFDIVRICTSCLEWDLSDVLGLSESRSLWRAPGPL